MDSALRTLISGGRVEMQMRADGQRVGRIRLMDYSSRRGGNMLLSGVFSATDSPILRPTMKATVKIIVGSFVVFAVALLAPQITRAQRITYLSNLGQTSDGNLAVGSNSWVAGGFQTGTNTLGYLLNSVQLGMADASGNPSGLMAMLYTGVGIGGISPGSSLGTLNGSLNPTTAGIFTYTPASSLTLSPHTDYFIVLTAGTAVANGGYEWNFTDTSIYNPGDDWVLSIAADSNNGSSWNYILGTFAQFAINATPIPEPGVLGLLGLGGLAFLWHRREAKAS